MQSTIVHEQIEAITHLGAMVEELIHLRAATAGMNVVNEKSALAADAIRSTLVPLAKMHLLNGERRACAVFDTFLHLGADEVGKIIGNDVDRVIPEFNVGRGRVDRAVFHKSGRLSLVEIKDAASVREVVGGIGQALMYAAQAERITNAAPIVPVLAVLGPHDEDIARACALGGVEYIPLGDIAWLRSISELIYLAVCDGS